MSHYQYELMESIKDINKNQWNNVMESSKYSTFFHSYDWQRLLEEGMNLEPRHIFEKKDENIISIFPNYIMSVRNSPLKRLYSIRPGYGGPIILSRNEKSALDNMFDYFPRVCCGNIFSHYVITYDLNYTRYGNYMREKGYEPRFECRFVIDLDQDIDTILHNMSHQKRRLINKNHDLEVIEKKIGEDELSEFHMHYSHLMKQIGAESYPLEFFTKMKDYVPDNVKIFEALCHGESAGQIMFFLDKKKNTIHKFFSGVEKECLKSNPTDSIVWHTLNWAKESGYKYYDFGPTGDDFCNGVFRHKSGFGGQIVPMIMWEKIYSRTRWSMVNILKSF